MSRIYNFSAGPAMLPLEVLEQAANEMVDYSGSGMSVLEMSHRSKPFEAIINQAESLLREIMNIPANYKVLFLQGGASSQFSMIPLNLFGKVRKADYILTGEWAKKAIQEAKRYGEINIVASSKDKNFNYIPPIDKSNFDSEAAYFHITTNNTIYGTVMRDVPETGDVPVVADMSSNILSEEIDVKKFGLIYAGAQKNIGPAGVTIVIIRDDLIGNALEITPTMFNYQTHVETNSLYNTPPTYAIYIAKLVFEWIKNKGGVKSIAKINNEKAKMLYGAIETSSLFKLTVPNPAHRSIMNIPFVLPEKDLEEKFIKEAAACGLTTLRGHRSVGGMRASIYNAMPMEGIKALVEFINEFDKNNK
ncbi:MAG: 3-phosphoserine/phosphohydroxythreonine aminotransferase [Candidatus Margulisiibacteriota bacterium]|nr:MAG: phosphoserine transaminase [Candidatus Margulisbacteria bacterium GWD2_39_127]OGI04615.1 MAG: phosphoserine transaminase [Candidatus Margulisbacteria bacterium GWF2_38_17]OGI11853.1 MAG: phosphoserine transaminase [Candidatus Margulisbacteria bacterium GWE2_39_32]PZM79772.1 MAG: 3-phosphoserine/phosphohydroxythreonine aminotransferase [Candidatus Margulisiibacteriota bacterium]HAR62677.1 3-phosphoserine/phosphohydroxythreonine aminotransferase [Candidatus Margulisiibacteriota bacterium]